MSKYKLLRFALLIFSCGFYALPIYSGECPGHPKGPSEMEEENRRYQRERDPRRELGDENQKEQYDNNQGDWANTS